MPACSLCLAAGARAYGQQSGTGARTQQHQVRRTLRASRVTSLCHQSFSACACQDTPRSSWSQQRAPKLIYSGYYLVGGVTQQAQPDLTFFTPRGLLVHSVPSRARFGTDKTRNCCHGSDSGSNAVAELSFFFGDEQGAASSATDSRGASAGASGWCAPGRVQPQLEGTTLCLIEPHAVREGKAGNVVSALQHHGFQITAAESFRLDRQQASSAFCALHH